jgi:hypothetical protein
MSKSRLVITAVTIERRSVPEVARTYGVARYQAEGEAAFELRSRRPKTSSAAISPDTARLRREAPQNFRMGKRSLILH